jgi:hypothetical protein
LLLKLAVASAALVVHSFPQSAACLTAMLLPQEVVHVSWRLVQDRSAAAVNSPATQLAQRQQWQPARGCNSKHKQLHPLLVPAAAASLDYLMQQMLVFLPHSRRCRLAV